MSNSLDVGIKKTIEAIMRINCPALILVAGYTCSGKSFVSSLFKKECDKNKKRASIICQDDYFKDIADAPRDGGRLIFDHPSSYRNTVFVKHVIALLAGRDIYSPAYDIKSNKITSYKGRFVCSASAIIAEGLYAIKFLEGLSPNTIKVYVHADEKTCLQSRIKRDVKMFGVTKEAVKKVFEKKVLPYQRQFVLPQREMADIIIVNNERRYSN